MKLTSGDPDVTLLNENGCLRIDGPDVTVLDEVNENGGFRIDDALLTSWLKSEWSDEVFHEQMGSRRDQAQTGVGVEEVA